MVTKCKSIDSCLLARVCMWREDTGTATLNSHAVQAWLFLYTPSYIHLTRRSGHYSFLKISLQMLDSLRPCSIA